MNLADGFRQVWGSKQKSCQENLIIMTGMRFKAEKLSRKPRYYDRFGFQSRKAIKKTFVIMTDLGFKAEKLSRKARYYDRFGFQSRKAVKKTSLL